MDALHRYQYTNVALFAVALPHALLTWPIRETGALFLGGLAIAFAAELAVVHTGLVDHNLEPQIASVPVAVLLAWPSIVYLCYRLALLAVPAGVQAAALAAVIATALDVLTDPNGVSEGVWEYPESPISRPRFRDVPLWNFLGWLAIVFAAAMLPTVVA